jgi:hypothetical protein
MTAIIRSADKMTRVRLPDGRLIRARVGELVAVMGRPSEPLKIHYLGEQQQKEQK